MKTEYISIKEFAEAVGVSQQAIYKQLNNKLKPFVKLVDGKKKLDKSAFELFEKKEKGERVEQPLNQIEQQLLNMLKKELEEKSEQLKEKDKQIAELQKLLDQSQKLNAMDKQKILELEDKMQADQEVEESEPKKKGLFSWLFGN
ncbi:MAG: hypothetical protein IKZ04_00420 [Spirochaetaceae bacterium]|nr:hypothetical protein [Spirochaetaceae bacterium]